MKYCVNPYCDQPEYFDQENFCESCGSRLLLNNRFSPIKKISNGSFGRIFKAVDEHDVNKSQCLIKQFFVEQQKTETTARIQINRSDDSIIPGYQAIEKLQHIHRREVENLSKLKHNQIPNLISYFKQDNYFYLVQEFIEGKNLKDEMERQGKFTEAKIWKLLDEILPVIKYIHENNIIHRDIKPDNIMRPKSNKDLVLVDFGAAKLVAPQSYNEKIDEETRISGSTAIGTFNYMAPEQNNGRVVFASDLYSLGLTCINLLTNKEPNDLFDQDTHSWNWKIYCKKKVSRKLAKILDKLIELGVSKRYHSADEVLRSIGKKIPKIVDKSPANDETNWQKVYVIAAVVGVIASTFFGLINMTNSSEILKKIDQVAIESNQELNYQKLITAFKEAVKTKNWEAVDQETYEILLKLGGKESQSRGWIDTNDLYQLPCADLRTIDNLWRAASDGKLGFSSQQKIYEEQGKDWKKMHEKVKWGRLTKDNFEELVGHEIDWTIRRRTYKPEMKPDFQDPVPGHLPVTKGVVKAKEFPQFASICKF